MAEESTNTDDQDIRKEGVTNRELAIPTTLFSAIPRNCFIYPVVGNENGVSTVCSATDLHATTSLRYQYTPGLDEPKHQYGKTSHINIESSDSNIEIIHSNSVILLHTLY